MNEPKVVVVEDWPSAMDAKTAAAYLGIGYDTFRRCLSDWPMLLRAFNYVPKGEARYSREGLDEFRRLREAGGIQRTG